MLIKFKARQLLKTISYNYQTRLVQDATLTEDECDEIIDVIDALDTAVSMLEREN